MRAAHPKELVSHTNSCYLSLKRKGAAGMKPAEIGLILDGR